MTDQQLIDALIERVQEGAKALAGWATQLPGMRLENVYSALIEQQLDAQAHRDLVAHLAGLLDMPTPERRAAALAALDLPQEPS